MYKTSKILNSFSDSLKVIGTSKQFKNKYSQQLFPITTSYVNCSCCIVCFAADYLLLLLLNLCPVHVGFSLFTLLLLSVLLEFVSVSVLFCHV